MVALQIRDVSEDVRLALVQQASERGQSLQAFLLALIEDQASRSKNLELLRRFSARTDGSQLSAAEGAQVVIEARNDRETRLIG